MAENYLLLLKLKMENKLPRDYSGPTQQTLNTCMTARAATSAQDRNRCPQPTWGEIDADEYEKGGQQIIHSLTNGKVLKMACATEEWMVDAMSTLSV